MLAFGEWGGADALKQPSSVNEKTPSARAQDRFMGRRRGSA